ncbi:MAG: hypothetical protein DMF64_18125 [Acidobacteria bacterium]|nr:MAG: hypothetical protein DMF64_18125 [Acidobacteriota bacterium]
MITGFNTDIEHNGTVYHVQTEDKGLAAPIILSLVYVGGAILASKRSPYDDLVAAGYNAQVLAERLQRQHKLICAAINAGRIEDLKRLQQREAVPQTEAVAPPRKQPKVEQAPAEVATGAPVLDIPVHVLPDTAQVELELPPKQPAEPEVVYVEAEQALHLNLMEEREFRAGEVVTIRVRVSRGPEDDRNAVLDAEVTVKILGSEFRPLMLRSKTDNDGVAIVHAWLPRFNAGRAAVLIRATKDDYAAELRRVIHH